MAAAVEKPFTYPQSLLDRELPPLPPHAVEGASCGCDVPETKSFVSQTYPTVNDLKRAAELPVYDIKGNAHPFRSLYADPSQRHLIIFIRHFFCGVCQEYVRTLANALPPPVLAAQPTPVNLVLVSCGDPSRIPGYISTTGCPFPVYTDPTRTLYQAFKFGRTLDLGPSKPDYIQVSLTSIVLTGIYQVLRSGTGAWKGGDFLQVGGELMFHQGRLEFFHRMRNTRDHPEMNDLVKLISTMDEEGSERAGAAAAMSSPTRRRWNDAVKAIGGRR